MQKAEKTLGMGGKSQIAQAAPAQSPSRPALHDTFKEKKEPIATQAPIDDNSFPFNSSLDSSIVGEINSRGPWVFWTIKTGDGNMAIYSQGETDARLYLINNMRGESIGVYELPAFMHGGVPVPAEKISVAAYSPEDRQWFQGHIVAEMYAEGINAYYAIMHKPLHGVVEH